MTYSLALFVPFQKIERMNFKCISTDKHTPELSTLIDWFSPSDLVILNT